MATNDGQTTGQARNQNDPAQRKRQPATSGDSGEGARGAGQAEAAGHGMDTRGGQSGQGAGTGAEVEGQALRTPGNQPGDQSMGTQQTEGHEGN